MYAAVFGLSEALVLGYDLQLIPNLAVGNKGAAERRILRVGSGEVLELLFVAGGLLGLGRQLDGGASVKQEFADLLGRVYIELFGQVVHLEERRQVVLYVSFPCLLGARYRYLVEVFSSAGALVKG